MRGDELIDERIDAALWSYAEPGELPETGVAVARVLARVESESQMRRVRWWGFALAASCLLVTLVVGSWILRGLRVPEIAWAPSAPGVVSALGSDEERVGASHPARAKSGRAQDGAPGVRVASEQWGARLPKMDVFPTPRPLTAEERGLVAFASEASPELKKQVVEAERHMGDPITIAELKIAPLASGVVQDSKDPERDKEK